MNLFIKKLRACFFNFFIQTAFVFIFFTLDCSSYASTWTNLISGNGGGYWGTNSNWTGGIPNATDATADFSTLNLSVNSTVTNDASRTVGTLKFDDTNSGNNWTLSGSNLTLATSSGLPAINVVSSSQTATMSVGLAGSQGFVKSGAGTLALSGINTFSGGVQINQGTFDCTADSLYAASGTLSVAAGTVLKTHSGWTGHYTSAIFIVLSGTGDATYGALHGLENFTLTGPITLNTDSKITHDWNNFTISGQITAAGGGKNLELMNQVSGQPGLQVNGNVNLGTGTLTINGVAGGSAVTLAGSNTLSGVTVPANGTVLFNSTNALGGSGAVIALNSGAVAALSGTDLSPLLARAATGSAGVIALNGATSSTALNFGSYPNLSLGSLGNSTYNGTLTPGGGNYRLGGGGGTLTVSSALNNAGAGLLVNGASASSMVVLIGTHTYAGTTTISGGTLMATGTLTGAVVVQSGGTLSPGPTTGIGTLTVNNAVELGGTTVFSINRTNAQKADLLVAGSLVLGGTINVTNIGPALQLGDSFQLLNVSGLISNAGCVPVLPALSAGLHWDFSTLRTNGTIMVASGTQTLFSVQDYGAVGNGVHDDDAAINAAVTAAKAAGSDSTIYFPAGTYYLVSGASSSVHINLTGAANLTLMGDSQTNTLLLSGDPYKGWFNVQNCTNLIVKNLSMDCKVLGFTQGTINSINAGEGSCTVTLDAGYDDLTRDFFATNALAFRVLKFTDSMRWDQNWIPTVTARQQVSVGQWNLTLSQTPTADCIGKPVVFIPDNDRTGPGFNFSGCSNILVLNVSWYGGWGVNGSFFYGGDCTGFITLSNYYVGPPPGSNRRFTGGGGSQGSIRGVLNLWNCDMSHMDDDGFNQLSSFYHIQAKPATATLQVEGGSWRVGDTASLWDWTYQQSYERDRATVTAVVQNGDGSRTVTLDHDVTILRTGSSPGSGSLQKVDGIDRLCNLTTVGTATIRNSKMSGLRARAILIHAQNVLIEGSTIYDTSMPGVMSGAEDYWAEGPQTRNLTIRSNLFENVDAPSLDVGFFDSFASRDYTNILVEGNTFLNTGQHRPANNGFPQGVGVRVRNANGAIIRNNIFDGVPNANIIVQNSWNVQVSGNQFRNTHPLALSAGTNFGIDSACMVWIDNCTNVSLAGNWVTNMGALATKLASVTATSTSVSGATNGIFLAGIPYILANQPRTLVLNDPAGGGAGTTVVQQTSAGNSSELWVLSPVGNGYCAIVCLTNGLALGVNGSVISNAPVVMETYTGLDSQLWALTPLGNSYVALTNKLSGLALHTPSSVAGQELVQRPFNGSTNQQWSLLSPVLGLTGTSGTGLTLTWPAYPGATSYTVKRASAANGPYATIASGVTGTSYTDNNVVGGTSYYYAVSAFVGGIQTPNSSFVAIQVSTLTWDKDGNSANGVTDGNGPWDGVSSRWFTGSGVADGIWPGSFATAIFGNSGTGTVTVSGTQDVAGLIFNTSYTLSGGTLAISTNNTLAVSNSANATISSLVTGTQGLTKTGSGTLTLAATNTYGGGTTVSAGTLQLGANNALGGGAVANAGTLDMNGFTLTNNLTFSANGATIQNNNAGASAIMNGNIAINGGYANFNANSGQTLVINGKVSGSVITKNNGGLVVLNGTNSNVGKTEMFGGTLRANEGAGLSGGAWLRLGGNGGNTVFETGADMIRPLLAINTDSGYGTFTISIQGGVSGFSAYGAPVRIAIGGLASPTPLVWGTAGFNQSTLVLNQTTANTNLTFLNALDLNGTNRSINVNASVATVGSIISNSSGTAGLTKSGAGKLVLTNANTYNGPTIIAAGTLALSGAGAIANSPLLCVNGGATLDVSGLSSTFVLGSSQTLSNGASGTGIINGSLNASGRSVSVAYTNGTAALTVSSGTLTLSAGTLFTVYNAGPALDLGSYPIILTSGTGAVGGVVPATVNVLSGGLAASMSASLAISNGVLNLVVANTVAPSPTVLPVLDGSGANLVLRVQTVTGHNYLLLSTTNLTPPIVWFTNSTTAGTGGVITNSVPIIHAQRSEYFRYLVQ